MTPLSDPAPASPIPVARPKNENLFVNIIFNIVLPALVLGNLSGAARLGPGGALVAALVFPLGYGVYDFVRRRKTNFISIISFVGVLMTGGLGLLKLGGFWFAVKDAGVSSLIGLAVLFSIRTREPLVKMIFCNETVMDLPRVNGILRERGNESGFRRLLQQCTLIVAAAFFVSAALGYALARYLLRSPSGTEQFNSELAKMHWLSWPIIVVPCMVLMMVALWRLVKGLKHLTGLTADEIFKAEPAKPQSPPAAST
ncbi:MAG: transporter [Verrucomicrobia bacterium]|nr:transporter [Verrucomicrobiota bacterium]